MGLCTPQRQKICARGRCFAVKLSRAASLTRGSAAQGRQSIWPGCPLGPRRIKEKMSFKKDETAMSGEPHSPTSMSVSRVFTLLRAGAPSPCAACAADAAPCLPAGQRRRALDSQIPQVPQDGGGQVSFLTHPGGGLAAPLGRAECRAGLHPPLQGRCLPASAVEAKPLLLAG